MASFPSEPSDTLFVAHVGQHRAAQFAIFQAQSQRRQIRRKRLHMMVVILRILAQIVARQLPRRPRLVERMAEQVIFGDARVQLLEEFSVFMTLSW